MHAVAERATPTSMTSMTPAIVPDPSSRRDIRGIHAAIAVPPPDRPCALLPRSHSFTMHPSRSHIQRPWQNGAFDRHSHQAAFLMHSHIHSASHNIHGSLLCCGFIIRNHQFTRGCRCGTLAIHGYRNHSGKRQQHPRYCNDAGQHYRELGRGRTLIVHRRQTGEPSAETFSHVHCPSESLTRRSTPF